MSEDNRPIVAWDKLLSTSIGLLTISGVLVGAIFWFARLEGGLTRVQASQLAQGARIDRIEESRSIGMQQLAKTRGSRRLDQGRPGPDQCETRPHADAG